MRRAHRRPRVSGLYIPLRWVGYGRHVIGYGLCLVRVLAGSWVFAIRRKKAPLATKNEAEGTKKKAVEASRGEGGAKRLQEYVWELHRNVRDPFV